MSTKDCVIRFLGLGRCEDVRWWMAFGTSATGSMEACAVRLRCRVARHADTSPWGANFEHGHRATVFWCGRPSTVIGTLDIDPARAAIVGAALLRAGSSARSLALHIPPGHTLDHTDITRTNRAVIHFEQADTTLPARR